jgi:hypothetical protein
MTEVSLPPLREDFTAGQPKLFPYAEMLGAPDDPLAAMPPDFGENGRAALPNSYTIVENWLSGLDGATTLHEVMYLMGIEDPQQRQERVTQLLDHATDHDIAFGRGETLDDLHTSGAPRLYQQLAHPLLRPTRTPEGLQFPYSHFGNTAARTSLLQAVKRGLNVHPDVVVNMGSGYDVTPSDAFPEARVVHVDMVPDIVRFLRRGGFEAYEPEQVPADLTSDLTVDVLGPGLGAVPLAPKGVFLTTGSHIPEGVTTRGLVPSTRHAILEPVFDPEAIREIQAHGRLDTHMLILQNA